MRLLLDTHTFLWFVTNDPQLSENALDAVAEPTNEILLSPASYWEIAIKISLGKYPLTVPFETQFGVITDVRDLEIPHILAQARRAGIPRHVRSLISHLRDMRHALAHLEPVKPQDLFSQEVFSCAEQFV